MASLPTKLEIAEISYFLFGKRLLLTRSFFVQLHFRCVPFQPSVQGKLAGMYCLSPTSHLGLLVVPSSKPPMPIETSPSEQSPCVFFLVSGKIDAILSRILNIIRS
jgi:hypothetical protein